MIEDKKLARRSFFPFHADHFDGMGVTLSWALLASIGVGLAFGIGLLILLKQDVLGIGQFMRSLVSTVPAFEARIGFLDRVDSYSGDYFVAGIFGHVVALLILWRQAVRIYKDFLHRNEGEFLMESRSIRGLVVHFAAFAFLIFFLFLFNIDFSGIGNVSMAGIFRFPIFLPFVVIGVVITGGFPISAEIFLYRLKLQNWRFPPRRQIRR